MEENNANVELKAKILVIGDSDVGKTSLVTRFTEDYFHESKVATIGIDLRTKIINIDNKDIKFQIWDTAGQERFRSMTQHFYNGSMGFIIVFDLTDFSSFQSIHNWIRQIDVNHIDDDNMNCSCKILIGNKCDLITNANANPNNNDDPAVPDHVNQVLIDDIVKKYKIEYFEASAKSGLNVEKAFYHLGKMVKRRYFPDDSKYNSLKNTLKITSRQKSEDFSELRKNSRSMIGSVLKKSNTQDNNNNNNNTNETHTGCCKQRY